MSRAGAAPPRMGKPAAERKESCFEKKVSVPQLPSAIRSQSVHALKQYTQCLRPYPDIVSSVIKHAGYWHECSPLATLWQRRKEPKGSIFVDAGANIGSCTLLMLAIGAATHSFEPMPANLFYLRESIARNPKFSAEFNLHPCGLGA